MRSTINGKLKQHNRGEVHTYQHFTATASGFVDSLKDGFACPKRKAIMALKSSATDAEGVTEMITSLGRQLGFNTTDESRIQTTTPVQAQQRYPYSYDIHVTPLR